MINRVVLVGRLVRDPELRNSVTGNPVASFTVAVDNRMKNPDGTKSASFIPCVVFSQQADNVCKFTKKGTLVGIEGRLNQRSYARADGTKATVIEVICDSVQFLEPKSQADEAITPSFNEEPAINESNIDSIELPDDDLPF